MPIPANVQPLLKQLFDGPVATTEYECGPDFRLLNTNGLVSIGKHPTMSRPAAELSLTALGKTVKKLDQAGGRVAARELYAWMDSVGIEDHLSTLLKLKRLGYVSFVKDGELYYLLEKE